MVMMKGVTGQTGTNPLIQPFSHDRELLSLEVDAQRLRKVILDGYLRSPMCFMPCFWPHQLILGMPCSLLFCTLPKIDQSAKAHRLILREKTLLYVVDRCPADGAYVSGTQGAKPICAQGCMGTAGGFEEVFPLQDIESCTVEPCRAQMCGADVAPETLVVRTNTDLGGAMFPAAAIDAPKNGAEFCAAVMAQVQKVKASGEQLDSALADAYSKYRNPTMGMNMMGMGMGMGMCGSMMQQQMTRQQMMMMMQPMQMMQQMQMQGGMYGPMGPGMQGCATPVVQGQVVDMPQSMDRS